MLREMLPASLSGLVDSDNAKKVLIVALPAAAVGAYVLYSWHLGRDLPPGPVGMPLLGRLPWTDSRNLHLSMLQVCEKYGDISSFYLGSRLFIVLNSYPMIKEMLEDPLFAGRPQLRLIKKLTRGCGIAFEEGESWSQQRRLSLRTLRDFGFARAKTVEMIDDQLDVMFQRLDDFAASSAPMAMLEDFILASNAIITELTLGHRFDRNDPEFRKMNALIQKLQEGGLIQGAAFMFRAVEKIVDYLPLLSTFVREIEQLHDFIRGEIHKREKIMTDQNSEPECLTDVYILERRKSALTGDTETFKEFQLVRVCIEFYTAGTDTTAYSMEWMMLYMAFYPDVQDRVQREIDELVGQSRRPRMQDKPELHYTSAVIDECYRKVSLAATGVFHRALQETTFAGFRIPSDAIIMPLVFGVHHRAEYWARPNHFYPEHFLDDKGHYRSSPYLIPFLIGRRSCIGESLARMEIFLFFTAIMQRYRVRPTSESLARRDEILAGFMGSFRMPGKYQLVVSRR